MVIVINFQIFGSSITNAMLSYNMLIVMYASGYVKFYSFQHILEKVLYPNVLKYWDTKEKIIVITKSTSTKV